MEQYHWTHGFGSYYNTGVAKVAAARRLSVRLFWILRTHTAYPEIVRIESSPAEALVGGSSTAKLIGRSL